MVVYYITQTRQTGLFIYEVSKYFTCFTGSVGRHSKFGKMYLKTLEALVIIRICSGIMFFSLSNSSLIMCSEAILPLFNSNYGKLLIVISCMVCSPAVIPRVTERRSACFLFHIIQTMHWVIILL